jgi:hypothetical protein
VLLTPVIAAVVVAQHAGYGPLLLVLVPIGLWSAAVWALGVTLAARRVRGREPELLTALAPRFS